MCHVSYEFHQYENCQNSFNFSKECYFCSVMFPSRTSDLHINQTPLSWCWLFSWSRVVSKTADWFVYFWPSSVLLMSLVVKKCILSWRRFICCAEDMISFISACVCTVIIWVFDNTASSEKQIVKLPQLHSTKCYDFLTSSLYYVID